MLFGNRYAEAFIAANDREQAQARVFEVCARIIEASPLLKSAATITNNKITFTATGASIVPLASDAASAAGAHPTVAVFDEIWGYTSTRMTRLWDELQPIPTQKISFRLIVSHAGFEGESDLLFGLYQRGLTLPKIGKDLYAGDGCLMFWSHTPIAPWQTEKFLEQARNHTSPAQYARMWENKFVSSENQFVEMIGGINA